MHRELGVLCLCARGDEEEELANAAKEFTPKLWPTFQELYCKGKYFLGSEHLIKKQAPEYVLSPVGPCKPMQGFFVFLWMYGFY